MRKLLFSKGFLVFIQFGVDYTIAGLLGPENKEAFLFGFKINWYFGLKIGTTYCEKKWFK